MKRSILLTCLLLYVQTASFAQVNASDLSNINTAVQAQAYADAHPDAELVTLEPDWQPDGIPASVINKEADYVFKSGGYTCKVVEVQSRPSFRVSYIYLSGEKYSKAEADKLRETIIAKYRSGTKFTSLVKQYNMDNNKTGDTNWFTENMMVAEFEQAVKAHKKGDIFTVDTPRMNWFHVVLKTHDDSMLKKLLILKIKSS